VNEDWTGDFSASKQCELVEYLAENDGEEWHGKTGDEAAQCGDRESRHMLSGCETE
jgi:hypothetical protein